MAGVWRAFSEWYFKKLTDRLSRMGLTYHDAIAETGVYEKAMSRLTTEQQIEHARRMKRALDLSAKHEEMPVAVREDPWREYRQVQAVFSETQKEVDERKHLSDRWWLPYHMGRETWHGYDTKSAWFWQKGGKGAAAGAGEKKLY